jgi:hypothetical protein
VAASQGTPGHTQDQRPQRGMLSLTGAVVVCLDLCCQLHCPARHKCQEVHTRAKTAARYVGSHVKPVMQRSVTTNSWMNSTPVTQDPEWHGAAPVVPAAMLRLCLSVHAAFDCIVLYTVFDCNRRCQVVAGSHGLRKAPAGLGRDQRDHRSGGAVASYTGRCRARMRLHCLRRCAVVM